MLFDELRTALAARPLHAPGPLPRNVREASVLAPLFVREGEPHLLFIKRAEGTNSHAGQIAFPGGKRRDADLDSLATALREAEEEVGIRGHDVDVLGRLDDYDTVMSGFRVTPYVGAIPFPYPLRSDAREVASLIEVNLAALLDQRAYREQRVPELFGNRSFHSYTVGEHLIWGATAAMVRQLLAVIRALPSTKGGTS